MARSTYYYKPRDPAKNEEAERLKRDIMMIFKKTPFYGYRKVCKALQDQGWNILPKQVWRRMKKMGLRAIYPKPNLSKPRKDHKKYPYLLKDITIDHVNQVWATDITYLRLRGGFVYLIAIIDLFSRKILSWRISNTLDNWFCIRALEEALLKYGQPEIFNSDQGSQFTSEDFIKTLEDRGIDISMDGKGRALDNIFIERFWRSLKYENIYLNDYQTVPECRAGVKRYFRFYNTQRYHQSLDYKTPDEFYYEGFSSLVKAA